MGKVDRFAFSAAHTPSARHPRLDRGPIETGGDRGEAEGFQHDRFPNRRACIPEVHNGSRLGGRDDDQSKRLVMAVVYKLETETGV